MKTTQKTQSINETQVRLPWTVYPDTQQTSVPVTDKNNTDNKHTELWY